MLFVLKLFIFWFYKFDLLLVFDIFISELLKDRLLSFVIKLCGLENDTTETLLPDKDLLPLLKFSGILFEFIELYILLLNVAV